MTDDALLARLDRLEARNTALEAEVRALRAERAAPPAPAPAPDGSIGRRSLLGKGLAAAGAAAAGAVLLEGRPAAATDGQPLIVGAQNGATNPTNLSGGSLGISVSTGRAFGIYSEHGEGMQIQSEDRAIGAFSDTGDYAIYAQSLATDGIGVYGHGKVGMTAHGLGTGATGLDAIAGQNGTAVVGTAAAGVGVRGRGTTYGVVGQSTTTDPDEAAVYASAIAGLGIGATTDTGQVMRGSSGSGGGIEVDAPRFHLRLTNSGTRGAPTADTKIHQRGDLVETTSGDLWLCTTGGTPGTWRKLAGPATAGAFHALAAPARVYDSRPGLAPTVGTKTPFGANTTRTFDLKANSSGVPAGATAVMVNLLLVNAAVGNGNLTVWANGATKPVANTLVWGGSARRFSTLAVTTVDTVGRCQVNTSLPTDLVIDVVGYYR